MQKINLILATYNGEKRLDKTLKSFVAMQEASGFTSDDWKIILVNNMSTDNTLAVAEKYTEILPLQIISTNEPGKSKALNEGLKYSDAPLIAFTDDDIEAQPDWLPQLIKCADDNPQYDVFGGNISGHWEKELDADLLSWIPINSTYALHKETISGPCLPDRIWGPNMMFRRKIFDAGNRFNELIGPTPGAFYAMGEDSQFCKHLAKQGYQSYYCYEAKIFHTIKAETANEAWILRRAERLGYGIFAPGIENYTPRLSSNIPVLLDVLLLRIIFSCLYPVAHIMPRGRKMFWWKWCYFFYKGLWKSYLKFIWT